jgi:hypothetical protein
VYYFCRALGDRILTMEVLEWWGFLPLVERVVLSKYTFIINHKSSIIKRFK